MNWDDADWRDPRTKTLQSVKSYDGLGGDH